MSKDITLTAPDGHKFTVFDTQFEGKKEGVIVLQEIFGVNKHIRMVTERFKTQGFRSIAPALFDRIASDVKMDYTDEGVQKGLELKSKLNWDDALCDIQTSIDFLKSEGCEKITVCGFCLGGSLAWLSATRLNHVDVAVSFYGGQVINYIDETPKCPTMLIFGGQDKAIPLSDIDTIKNAHPDLPVQIYSDAGHGFNCELRASYHEDSAMQARKLSLEFIRKH